MRRWISLEGVDMSGKTTVRNYLTHVLETAGYNVLSIDSMCTEDTTDTFNNIINYSIANDYFDKDSENVALLLSLMLTYSKIKDHINNGGVVISEGFLGRLYVKSSVTPDRTNRSKQLYYYLRSLTIDIKPDLEFIIDVPEEVLIERYKVLSKCSSKLEVSPTLTKNIEGYRQYSLEGIGNKSILLNNSNNIIDLKNVLLSELGDINYILDRDN
jgi:thymidylate kinase